MPRKTKKLKSVDPFNFKAQEESRIKAKGNLPPQTYDQEIPRSYRELFMQPKFSETAESRQHKKAEDNFSFTKKTYENERQFVNRVHRETADFVNEELHKIKYDLVGVNEPELGTKKPDKLSRKEKNILAQRKSLKLKSDKFSNSSLVSVKKSKKRKKPEIDLLNVKDFVRFGERVDEPPNLTVAPKKLKKIDASIKAGNKNLLLKNLMQPSEDSTLSPLPQKSLYPNDGTIKCDDAAKQKMLIEERNRVIEAYRSSQFAKRRKL